MVDVQEQQMGKKKPSGREIKSKLLHSICGQDVEVIAKNNNYSGKLVFVHGGDGHSEGFYVDGRHISIREVHRVYPEQHRIELYAEKRDTQ